MKKRHHHYRRARIPVTTPPKNLEPPRPFRPPTFWQSMRAMWWPLKVWMVGMLTLIAYGLARSFLGWPKASGWFFLVLSVYGLIFIWIDHWRFKQKLRDDEARWEERRKAMLDQINHRQFRR